MVLANIYGQMVVITKETSWEASDKAKEYGNR